MLETYREQLAKGSQAPSPEAEAAREQLRGILERAIGDLPESFRTVFVLHEIEGVSVEEAALALEIPTGTVKTRLMRARRKLQQALARALQRSCRRRGAEGFRRALPRPLALLPHV